MKTVSEIYKNHPILFIICVVLLLFCIIPLSPLGYEAIIGFKKEPVNWNNYISNLYSLVVTTTIALIVYLLVDKKTSDKISEIKNIEDNIQEKTKNISEITTKIQSNINTQENSVQKISGIQDKIAFETEKNRLTQMIHRAHASEEDEKKWKQGITLIFEEKELNIQAIKNQNNKEVNFQCTIVFIKNNKSMYALPKMFHPFNQIHDFPYFCVLVKESMFIKNNPDIGIQIGTYYFLHYHLNSSNNEKKGWYLSKSYIGPVIHNSFKVRIISISPEPQWGDPSADDVCKNC